MKKPFIYRDPDPDPDKLWTPATLGSRLETPADARAGLVLPSSAGLEATSVDREEIDKQVASFTRCAATLDDLDIDGVEDLRPTLDQVIALLSEIPFEAGMIWLAPIAADVYHHSFDADHQLGLAGRIWGNGPLLKALKSFVESGEGHLVFEERYITALQRLLVEHASDSDEELNERQRHLLASLIIFIPTALPDDSPPVADPDHPTIEELEPWARYTLRNGAYYDRTHPEEAIVRTHGILVDAPDHPSMAELSAEIPLEEWFQEDFGGIGLNDQMTAGIGLATSCHAWDESLKLEEFLRFLPSEGVLADTNMAEDEQQIIQSLSGSRDEIRKAFAEAGDSPMHIAWDRAVFEQFPFLKLKSGHLLPISPRAVYSWLSDGIYYRGLDCANRRPHPNKELAEEGKTLGTIYTAYVGKLAEVYVRELAESTYSELVAAGAADVSPEMEYKVGKDRKDSSDLFIVEPPEVAAIEIFSGRMPREARVDPEAESMDASIGKMVTRKLEKLSRTTNDLLAGHVPVPTLDLTTVERVWPVLVLTGQGLLNTPILWTMVRERLAEGTFADSRIASPTLCDLDDFEALMALVEEKGVPLKSLLADLHSSEYAELPPRNWIHAQYGSRIFRPRYLDERFDAISEQVRARLFDKDAEDQRG